MSKYYLKSQKRYKIETYNRIVIGTYKRFTQGYHFKRPWPSASQQCQPLREIFTSFISRLTYQPTQQFCLFLRTFNRCWMSTVCSTQRYYVHKTCLGEYHKDTNVVCQHTTVVLLTPARKRTADNITTFCDDANKTSTSIELLAINILRYMS